MSWISGVAAPAHFVAGVALFTLAAMICPSVKRAAANRNANWGLVALAALGLAQWCSLPLIPPTVGLWAQVACDLAALAALIELGVRGVSGRHHGLLPRGSSLIVAALALAAAVLGQLQWFELGCRLIVSWQAGSLFWNVYGVDRRQRDEAVSTFRAASLAVKTIVGALVAYLGALCGGIALAQMLSAMVAAAAAYLTCGPAATASRQARLAWRCAWPVGFALIVAGGYTMLSAVTRPENVVLAVEEFELAEPQAAEESADARNDQSSQASANESVAEQLAIVTTPNRHAGSSPAKRVAMGVVPIVLFVLAVWGLSRLPCVH